MFNIKWKPFISNSESLEWWFNYKPKNLYWVVIKKIAIAKINRERKWYTMRENETLEIFYKRVGIKYSYNEKPMGETTIMMSNKRVEDKDEMIDDTVETMIHNLNRRK